MCQYCARLAPVKRAATQWESDVPFINALVDTANFWQPDGPDNQLTLTYTFAQAPPAAGEFSAPQPFSTNQQVAVERILAQFAATANITFVRDDVGTNAQLKFGDGPGTVLGNAYGVKGGDGQLLAMHVHLDTSESADWANFQPGGYGYYFLMHLIGHALGLKHPGQYNAWDVGPFLPFLQDNQAYSVMSYNRVGGRDGSALGIHDLTTLRFLYGGLPVESQLSSSGDTFFGTAEPDRVYGFDGNDSLLGEDSSDTLFGNAGSDTLLGGENRDSVYGGRDDDVLYGNSAGDVLAGNLGADSLFGGAGGDTLRGGRDNDSLSGGDGNDVVGGDLGNDELTGGAGNDTFLAGSGGGNDVVYDFTRFTDALLISGFSSRDVLQAALTYGSGHTVLTFADGGTLTVLNITLAGSDFTLG